MLTQVQAELQSRGLQVTAGSNSITVTSAVVTAADEFASLQTAFAAAETPEAKTSVADKIKKFLKRHWTAICAGGYMYTVVYTWAKTEVVRINEYLKAAYTAGLNHYDHGGIGEEELKDFAGTVTKRAKDARLTVQVRAALGIAGVTALLVFGITQMNKHLDRADAKKAKRDAKKAAKRAARMAQVVDLNKKAQAVAQKAKQLEAKSA